MSLIISSILLSHWCFVTLQATPVLSSETELSRTGHFKLSWQPEEPDQNGLILYELEGTRASDGKTTTLYSGPDRQTFISGLPDGDYTYRVRRQGDSNWSMPVRVEVKHYSLQLAFVLFILGAIVFGATVFMVMRGARKVDQHA